MTLYADFYESQFHFITPAALAVTEQRPQTIADQRWIFKTTGVAIVDFTGKSSVDWSRDELLISPPLGNALNAALARYLIPTPPIKDAFPWMQVEQWFPQAGLSSVFDRHQAVDMGFAVDRWRPEARQAREAATNAVLPNMLSGMRVDLAVRDSDATLHRVSYSITVEGKIKFVTGLL
jgi:hypothetical protein